MLYIILLFVFVVVYLMMLMRRQKEKMSEIKIQIDQLQAQHDRLQEERDQIILDLPCSMGMDIHVVSMDVETIAVIKKNKKYNTKGCVKVMQELS